MVQLSLALGITLLSSCALNVGYLIEHSVAARLPRLSSRHPLQSARLLLSSRRWLAGFTVEIVGWLLYVAALALAPLSLVQATAAGGIGILALMASRFTAVTLGPRERVGVVFSVAGLVLLGMSLAGAHGRGDAGSPHTVALWLVASAAAGLLAIRFGIRFVNGGATFGLAAGIFFAAGDVATKTAVSGGGWHYAFAPALVTAYLVGTAALQAGFQRGGALTTAGIATLLTNALPIAAGMTVFGEPLPGGFLGALRIVSFAAVICGAVALARTGTKELDAAPESEPEPQTASA